MRYIEAVEQAVLEDKEVALFLAGGITGCPDWQAEMCIRLGSTDLALLNPRRKNFPIHDPTAAKAQITWEWQHLQLAHAISFWFPAETIQPIALFELGRWSSSTKPIFVGVHETYPRRQDVEIQLKLERPDLKISYSMADLADQIKKWWRELNG